MSETKYRIPKMAVAVMVLGANGCGDDDGGSSGSRVENLGKGVCKLVYSCEDGDWALDPDDPDITFSSEEECVEQFTKETQQEFAGVSAQCRNAFLAYYECYVDAGCDGDEEGKCEKLYKAYYDACEDEG
ncbi:MAG TPA: hypothetical protein VFX59_19760 [Polyangiales bacterium]|nr:hypothetical protein [Polyangiales bacterium]